MSAVWQLQDAKNKFSELVNHAQFDGPQEITRHGKKMAVVLSFADFQKLKKKKETLAEFFLNSPLKDIEIERNRDFPRDIVL